MITITAGWSGDNAYCLEDVNKLYRGVKRNTTLPSEGIAGRRPYRVVPRETKAKRR